METLYIFGYSISLYQLSIIGLGICILVALIFAFLNATHNSAYGDYGTRQALFMHSVQGRSRRDRDSEERDGDKEA